MIELVFVIAVLGIVASIGAEIIAQLYSGYVSQRAIQRSSMKTELAVLQIVNRLTYAVPNTVIARPADTSLLYAPLDEAAPANWEVLQWIGSDEDSFQAMTTAANAIGRRRRWSGFCDVDNPGTGANTIVSPASNFGLANTIIGNLSDSTRGLAGSALFFAGDTTYNAHHVGYVGNPDNAGANRIAGIGATPDRLILNPIGGDRRLSQNYKLAWTSYALVPVNVDATNQTFDLELRYNFQPWNGENYFGGAESREILIRDVSLFRFMGRGNTIRIKLCQREQTEPGIFTNICKEKAVIR
jgi:Tfp pilus assembly protein PilE